MKKTLLVLLVMLLGISVAFSQLGIKAGVNLGTIGGDDKAGYGVDPTSQLGLVGGVSYNIGLLFGLSIQPEVLYVQKGAIYDNPFHKITSKVDYIDIPILVKYNLPIPLVSPYIQGGISYGILASAKLKTEYTALGGNLPSTESNNKDAFAKNDFSIIIGIGVDLLIIDINARYVLGTTKLDDNGNVKAYNRGIMLTAGIRF